MSIDILIVIIFAYNIIIGITQGLLKSLLGIASFVLATIFSPLFQSVLGGIIQKYVNNEQELNNIFGLGFSWLILYTILNIVSGFIIKTMEKTPLKILDRLAGVGVGLFMSVIIVVIPLLIIKAIPIIKEIPKVKTSMDKSVLVHLFVPITTPFENFFITTLKSQRDEIMKKLKQNAKSEFVKVLGQSKEKDIKELMKAYDIKPMGKDNKVNIF